MIRKKLTYVGLILSLLLNLIIIFFFRNTIYSEIGNIGKHLIRSYKTKDVASDFKYYSGIKLNIEGKFHNEENYNRLPIKYKNIVRPEVWNLSQNSSGISVKFRTNSPDISVKWKLASFHERPDMSRICVSGLDLYCFNKNKWQFVRSGIPEGIENEQLLISGMDTTAKEFLLNLPLYDSIENIEIGIKNGFNISKTLNNYKFNKPIVFYGTSITQGGSPTRPGLAYPSIISRELNVETINLGFAGNGKFEKTVGVALCEIDASIYVIDCIHNSSPEIINTKALDLIMQIRSSKPNTPILLVEGILKEYSYFQKSDETVPGGLKYIQKQNNELRKVYDKAIDLKLDKIFYLSSDGLIGYDHEGTVDGTHLNDLGMKRISEKIKRKIEEIL